MNYLHTMIRVADPDATVAFFELLGLEEVRRMENEQGRFTLIFLAVPEDTAIGDRRVEVELTYNWPPETASPSIMRAAATSATSPIASTTSTRPARR